MSETDPLLDTLHACASRLPALADGHGQTLDLAGALLPDVPRALATRALNAVDTPPPEPLLADDGALTLALAATLGTLAPKRWRDHLDGLTADATCRPHAWAHLSEAAVTLDAWLALRGPGRRLVSSVAEARLMAPSHTFRTAIAGDVARAARANRLAAARGWLVAHRVGGLDDALTRIARSDVAMAAAEGVSEALARVVLGDALDGEVTVAVLPAGVLVEWDGDGAPPDEVRVGTATLSAAAPTDSRAVRAWWLTPDASGDALVLHRKGTSATVTPRR